MLFREPKAPELFVAEAAACRESRRKLAHEKAACSVYEPFGYFMCERTQRPTGRSKRWKALPKSGKHRYGHALALHEFLVNFCRNF